MTYFDISTYILKLIIRYFDTFRYVVNIFFLKELDWNLLLDYNQLKAVNKKRTKSKYAAASNSYFGQEEAVQSSDESMKLRAKQMAVKNDALSLGIKKSIFILIIVLFSFSFSFIIYI